MRTENSIKNVISNVFFNILIAILGFLKIKVFINGLSTDIYSLNQLFYQVFSYLAIADIGFGLVINKNLYKAFAKKDDKEIKRIFYTSKKFYTYLGIFLIFASIICSFFIHNLTKASVDIGYMRIIFIVFILFNILDYFFEAPNAIISADEKLYEVNHLIKGIKIITVISQIILVMLKVDYLFVILPNIFISLAVHLYINKKIYKKYEYLDLQNKKKEDLKFDKKYLKGTGDLIPAKIAGVLNSNTDIILISKFISPLMVNIYSSYNFIIKFLVDTIYIISAAIVPSFANFINLEDTERSYGIFKELNIFFLFVASFIGIMTYVFFNDLITLWIGKSYLLPSFTVLLLIIWAFEKISQKSLDIVIDSKGYFKETKTVIFIEAILNFVISIIFVKRFGVTGVIWGSVIAYSISTFIYKPFFIYKEVFKKNMMRYFASYSVVFIYTIILMYILSRIDFKIVNAFSFIWKVVLVSIFVLILNMIFFTSVFKEFRKLNLRGKNISTQFIKRKKEK